MPHLVHLEQLSTTGTVLKLDAQDHELQVGLDPVTGELLCHTCPAITPTQLSPLPYLTASLSQFV